MSMQNQESSTLKELKSLKVESSDDREIIEKETMTIGVLITTTKITTISSKNEKYDVSAFFIDKVTEETNPFVFCKSFKDKSEAYEYYNFIINKVKEDSDDIIFKAMSEDNISHL